jgi:hypothetical protein
MVTFQPCGHNFISPYFDHDDTFMATNSGLLPIIIPINPIARSKKEVNQLKGLK